jgi:hypothetical protein
MTVYDRNKKLLYIAKMIVIIPIISTIIAASYESVYISLISNAYDQTRKRPCVRA